MRRTSGFLFLMAFSAFEFQGQVETTHRRSNTLPSSCLMSDALMKLSTSGFDTRWSRS